MVPKQYALIFSPLATSSLFCSAVHSISPIPISSDDGKQELEGIVLSGGPEGKV